MDEDSQWEEVLQLVEAHPGATSRELAEASGLERIMIARRLPELAEAKAIRKGEPRLDYITGRAALTWWPI